MKPHLPDPYLQPYMIHRIIVPIATTRAFISTDAWNGMVVQLQDDVPNFFGWYYVNGFSPFPFYDETIFSFNTVYQMITMQDGFI